MPPVHMEIDARERFLAGVHAGTLSVVESGERAPLVTPVWSHYRPGGVVRVGIEDDGRCLEAIRRVGRATLTVQRVPYGCVAVEGTLLVSEPTDPSEYRRWVLGCLGAAPGERYYRSVEDDLEHMRTVRLLPSRWRTRDFTR